MKFCANCGSPLPEAAAGAQDPYQSGTQDPYQSGNQYQGSDQYQNSYQNSYSNAGYGQAQRPTNGMGVAALVLGIVGLIVSWFTLGIPSILAIVFGILGISKAKKDPRYGSGMAIAGLVMGIIVFAIVLIVVVICGMLLGMGTWALTNYVYY